MRYLSNAFSMNMLPEGFSGGVMIEPLQACVACSMAGRAEPAIGHETTARLVRTRLLDILEEGNAVAAPSELERATEFNRATIALSPGDELIVAQYRGPRLPEGAMTLPEGAKFSFVWVLVAGGTKVASKSASGWPQGAAEMRNRRP